MTNNQSQSGETIERHLGVGQLPLKYRLWIPSGTPRGIVVVLHGIQSHSGWYTSSCAFLASQGFVTASLDRRGSGLNNTDPGHADSFKTLIEDISLAVDSLTERFEKLPVHLIGISWGAKSAAGFGIIHPEKIQSLIFSGPGFKSVCDFSFIKKLQIGLGVLIKPRSTLPIPIGQGWMFTNTPRRIDYIDNDPLTLHRATLRFYMESKRLDLFLVRNWNRLKKPCCLMMGTEDLIMDVPGTINFFNKLSGDFNRITTYENAAHTLEFEEKTQDYFEDMAGWLSENTPGTAKLQ